MSSPSQTVLSMRSVAQDLDQSIQTKAQEDEMTGMKISVHSIEVINVVMKVV